MAKSSHNIGSKQFFTLVVASSAALMLIIATTFLAQKPTNTESHAASNCKNAFNIKNLGATNSGTHYVVYSIKVSNPNSNNCSFGLITYRPSNRWTTEYKLEGEKNFEYNTVNLFTTGKLSSGNSTTVKVRVTVNDPAKVPSKTYSLNTQVCDVFNSDVPILGSNCNSTTLKYIKN